MTGIENKKIPTLADEDLKLNQVRNHVPQRPQDALAEKLTWLLSRFRIDLPTHIQIDSLAFE